VRGQAACECGGRVPKGGGNDSPGTAGAGAFVKGGSSKKRDKNEKWSFDRRKCGRGGGGRSEGLSGHSQSLQGEE